MHGARSIPLITSALALVAAPLAFAQNAAPNPPVGATPAPSPSVDPDPRMLFAGAPFSFAGGTRERQALEGAIEHIVSDMFFAIRPIARSRLRALNPAYASVTIRFASGNIEMVLPGAPFFRSPENGRSIAWTAEDGNPAQLSQRLDRGRIVQTIVASNGQRRNEYAVSPDGHTLTLQTRITAGQLPGPLVYALTYRR